MKILEIAPNWPSRFDLEMFGAPKSILVELPRGAEIIHISAPWGRPLVSVKAPDTPDFVQHRLLVLRHNAMVPPDWRYVGSFSCEGQLPFHLFERIGA